MFNYFIGLWEINRILGNIGTAKGLAIFKPYSENQLDYFERLETNYKTFKSIQYAVKNYTYIFNEKNEICKAFEDESISCNLDLSSCKNYASGSFLCGTDWYNAYYSFIDPQNFTLEYIVKGPQKDFTIYSRFTKIM